MERCAQIRRFLGLEAFDGGLVDPACRRVLIRPGIHGEPGHRLHPFILMLRISAWMHSLQAGTTPLTDTQSKSSTDSTSSGTDTSASFPVSASVQPFKSGILTAPTPKFRVGA